MIHFYSFIGLRLPERSSEWNFEGKAFEVLFYFILFLFFNKTFTNVANGSISLFFVGLDANFEGKSSKFFYFFLFCFYLLNKTSTNISFYSFEGLHKGIFQSSSIFFFPARCFLAKFRR
jgi:hypothetical protein